MRVVLAVLAVLCWIGCESSNESSPSSETCAEGLRACGDSCVDIHSDASHCGGCDQSCASTESCLDGDCVARQPSECEQGQERCGEACVDLQADASNCGSCGHACPGDEICIAGNCGCAGGESCDGVCVDTSSSDAHCGGCGIACEGERHCEAGRCVCAEGLEACGDACVDLDETVAHCGSCDVDCGALPGVAEVDCASGACKVLACAEGFDDCDDDPSNGCEAETRVDSRHCGACGADCGNLPNVAVASCEDGSCRIVTCEPGFDDCDGDPSNGCEVNVRSDPDNCGVCERSCEISCAYGACAQIVELSAGRQHTCARTDTGEVWCWGDNSHGQLGVDVSSPASEGPVRVAGIHHAVSLAQGASADHVCAVSAGGAAFCWGKNESGQLGDGTTTSRHEALAVEIDGSVMEVAVGADFTCARLYGGEVWCWGSNDSEQLGRVGGSSSVPVRAEGLAVDPELRGLRAGRGHVCVIAPTEQFPTGQAYCWGRGSNGQLGTGLHDARALAAIIPNTPFTGVASGDLFTCAWMAEIHSGNVMCWGRNAEGQLGANIPPIAGDFSTPIGTMFSEAVEVAAGGVHACARKSDGKLSCWGGNAEGQLGVDTEGENQAAPVQVDTLGSTAVQQITAGAEHTCVLSKENEVWCWGGDAAGPTGEGGRAHQPRQVRW